MTDRTIVEAVKKEFKEALFAALGRFPEAATRNDRYLALALAVRRQVMRRWVATSETYYKKASRTVCYLSAEFLLGPHLGNNLLNLGLQEEARQAMSDLGYDLDDILAQEEEPGLGNGGLGRLAACYMDSLATLEIPTLGYGIRYEFGIFDQLIRDGWQVEKTDKWLALGNPWETARPEIAADVFLGGHTEGFQDERGRYRVRWVPDRVVRGVAYDVPILGYRNGTANLLRLWKAEATESFDFDAFNQGDYWRAVDQKVDSENITKVLYPNDELVKGKRLRLEQQYFFVSCSLQDMIRIYRQRGGDDLSHFHEKYAIQLNDTHPAVAVAELMRLLVDVHGMGWDEAWEITRRHVRLHEPHPASRGAREVEGGDVRLGPAAPSRDRLRDQPPVPGRGPDALPGRRGPRRPPQPDRRVGRALGADGAPRERREPPRSTAWRRCTRSC